MIYEWVKKCIASSINPICVHSSQIEQLRLDFLGDEISFHVVSPGDILGRNRDGDEVIRVLVDLDRASDAAWDSLLGDLENSPNFHVITVSDFFWLPEALRSRVKAANVVKMASKPALGRSIISYFTKPSKDFKSSDEYSTFLNDLESICRLNPTKASLELYSRILRVQSINPELHVKTLCE